ncbi:type II secretion system F family protein [Herbaspirillum sp. HC18]|nr:type II secretion system F family protein [Herbaspirillum sp. HC18]
MDLLFLMFVVAVFIAVILMFEGLYVTWNSTRGAEAKRIARRLQAMTMDDHGRPGEATIRKQRAPSRTEGLERLLLRLPHIDALERLLQQAGSSYEPGRFLLVSFMSGATALVVALFLPIHAFFAMAAGMAAAAIPLLLMQRQRRLRLGRIEEQLPDALDLMSRALRAGHALPAAIEMAAKEMADPIAGEFRTVFDEVTFGVSMQDALNGLAARVPGTDVGYFVVAVLIQRETGGNLTELLGNISSIVRERFKLYGQVRTLSAEGRLSAWILTVLPFALTGVMQLINPGFMNVLWSEQIGMKLTGGMMVLMMIGIFWMRAIVRIRV